jgi:integrase
MGAHRKGPRVLGPYEYKDGRAKPFRLDLVQEVGPRVRVYCASRRKAWAAKRALTLKLERAREGATAIEDALVAYEMYLRNEKQNKFCSVLCTLGRLRAFIGSTAKPLRRFTPRLAQERYNWARERWATDTHRCVLSEAKTFFRWCCKRKFIRRSPIEGVEPTGRRRFGKPQPRIVEARRWMARALANAEAGDAGAVAAMMTLLLGLRASEIITRQVRGVDDDGRSLWIPSSKTEAGRRTLEVPDLLAPFLRRLAGDRPGEDMLFGLHWRDWPRKEVERLCREVGIPRFTAHGMRGAHATFATERGATGHIVAAALGHVSPTTTYQSYVAPGTVQTAQQRKVPERGWHALRHTFGTDAARFGVNPWTLMMWLGHKRIDETMLYVNLANAHRRPIPAEVLAAGEGEKDPDLRVLKMLGARANLVQTERATDARRA